MERCTTAEYDSKLKGRVPKLDSTRFTNAFAEATIVGWKGVTYRKLIKSGILPIDIEQIPEEDRDVEIPFEVGEAAKLLEKAGTDFNVVVGLCVGHDSLFYKYTHTLTTTLVTKDRVLAHNPVGALYQTKAYYKKLMADPASGEKEQ